ncbi:Uncharacterised protein [Vibrio cholerae]|nr:Uncharacterised protein [Vibrio cholerae]
MRRFSPVAHSAKCSPKPNGVFRGRTNGEVESIATSYVMVYQEARGYILQNRDSLMSFLLRGISLNSHRKVFGDRQ